MTSRYHWISFAIWQGMTTAARDETEKWARANGLEVAIDLRDDHQKGPTKSEPKEDE